MIGKKIKDIRKRRGLTLSEVAERAEISKSYLSNIERNLHQNPSLRVINKIASVLNVDLKVLLTTEKNRETQVLDQEWMEFVKELKNSGIGKEQLQDLIEFIHWRNKQNDNKKNCHSV